MDTPHQYRPGVQQTDRTNDYPPHPGDLTSHRNSLIHGMRAIGGWANAAVARIFSLNSHKVDLSVPPVRRKHVKTHVARGLARTVMAAGTLTLLSACASTTTTPQDPRWQPLPAASSPVAVNLPWARMKPVRVRKSRASTGPSVVTEASYTGRANSYPLLTVIVQDIADNDHAFLRPDESGNTLDQRIRGVLKNRLKSIGIVKMVQSGSVNIEHVAYTTTKPESCVAFRRYSGLPTSGQKVKAGTLLGTTSVLALYCESGVGKIDNDKRVDLIRNVAMKPKPVRNIVTDHTKQTPTHGVTITPATDKSGTPKAPGA